MIAKCLVPLLYAGLSLHGNAALLVYEGFDYAAGAFTDANGHNGGSGWDSAWVSINAGSPTETIESGSLTSPVPHLPATGGFLRVIGSGDRFHRNLDGQNFGADGTTIYISFLARQLGTTAPNGAIELTKNNGSTQNIVTFGSDNNGVDNFGVVDKTGGDDDIPVIGTAGSALAPDTDTHLWVLQIDYLAGDDTITFWYDGVLQGSQSMGNLSFDEFGALFFSGTAGMEIDEVRIGTLYEDVASIESIISLEPEVPSLASGADGSVSSAASIGTVLGGLSSISPAALPLDPGVTYTLVSGTGDDDNGLFSIVGQELRTNADLSGEVGNTLNLRVGGIGGGYSGEAEFKIVVVDSALMPGDFEPGSVGAFLNGNFPTETPAAAAGAWVTENAFPNLSFNELIGITVEPRSNHLFVLERDGDVFRVENNPVTATKTEVLSVNVSIKSNSGFRSMICHPDFNLVGSPFKDDAFVFYSTTVSGDFVYRLSRVTRAGNGVFGSEEVMIQQYTPDGGQHFSGGLAFDENGYLVVTMGDMELSEGGTGVPLYQDVQRIDRIFQGAVLRLDVDKQGGATSFAATRTLQGGMVNGVSTDQSCFPGHAYYSAQNLSGIGYFIPTDNYFVTHPPAAGAGGAGYPAHGDALEEHQALGVRNPWRLAYDPVDHDMVWFSVGSNGTERYEEIELLTPGGNYGWPFAEGVFSDSVETGRTTPPSLYAPTFLGVTDNTNPKQMDPLWYYSVTLGNGDRAVAGGVMYRGSTLPELTGKLVYGDSASGRIWSLDYKGKTKANFVNTELIDSSVLVRQMTAGPQGEKIYMVDGTGVHLLTKSTSGSPEPPALLSQTGAFSNLATLTPAAGLIPYTPASPLWSDRSDKYRWVALPNGDGVAGEYDLPSEKIVFSEDGDWTYPAGTVFIKHFELALDEGNPSVTRRLETRFLVLGSDDVYYGVTYKWRADGTDADLLISGDMDTFTITPESGPSYEQIWDYPSRQDCLECHRSSASSVLGPRTRQLNHPITYPGDPSSFNQLSTLRGLSVFTEPSFDVSQLETYLKAVSIDDPTAPLEHRVRSYLDANCAMCHDGVQNGQALFDARLTTPLAMMGIIDENPEAGGLGIGGAKIILPGDPSKSVLFLRDGKAGRTTAMPAGDPDRMPPLARNVVHQEYLDELEAWILQLDLPEYQQWVASNGILGGWDDDDDGDMSSNLFEFVVGTNAKLASSVFRPSIAADFSFSLPVTGFARTDGINVTTQDSGNLVDWFDLGTGGSAATLDSDTSSPGTDGILKVLLNSGEERRFIRGKVEP